MELLCHCKGAHSESPYSCPYPTPHIPGPLLNHFPSQPLRLWAHFLGGIEMQTQILVTHGILNTYVSIGMKLYHDTPLQLMSHSWCCLSQVESIERGPEISVIKKNKWHWVSWRRTIFKADNRRQSTEPYILAHRCVCGAGGSCVIRWNVYTITTTHSITCGNGRDVPLLACSLVLLQFSLQAWLAFIKRKWNYFGPSLGRRSVSCIVISFVSSYSHILAFSSPLGLQKAL